MPRPWDEVRRERLASFKVFDVIEATRRSPRTGRDIGFFLIDTWDWVNVVAFTAENDLLLVRQYRHGPREVTLEIPGGAVHPGEELALAAARELREETGHAAERLELIGAVNPNPSIFDNRCHTFLATGCKRVGELQQDEGEDIEVATIPLAEVERGVLAGEISHALVLAGLYLHRLRADRS